MRCTRRRCIPTPSPCWTPHPCPTRWPSRSVPGPRWAASRRHRCGHPRAASSTPAARWRMPRAVRSCRRCARSVPGISRPASSCEEHPMLSYVLRRLGLMLPTLLGVAVISFFLLRVVPGDVVELRLRSGGGNVSAEVVQQERVRLGMDRPLPRQFADWMGGLATGDLGTSMWTGQPIAKEIGTRIGLSLQVAAMAAMIAVVIAIPLGTLSALFRDTWIDYAIRFVTMAGLAVPSFWLGMLLIMALLLAFHWSPPVTYTPFFVDPVANLSQLIWPAL